MNRAGVLYTPVRLPDQLERWHTKWARGPFPCIVEGSKEHTMKNKFQSLIEDPAFVDAINSMSGFFYEMNPDIDMCYDYICEQADIHSFVADDAAWDMFYKAWEKVSEENFLVA